MTGGLPATFTAPSTKSNDASSYDLMADPKGE